LTPADTQSPIPPDFLAGVIYLIALLKRAILIYKLAGRSFGALIFLFVY